MTIEAMVLQMGTNSRCRRAFGHEALYPEEDFETILVEDEQLRDHLEIHKRKHLIAPVSFLG